MHLSALLQFAISNDFKELSSTQFENLLALCWHVLYPYLQVMFNSQNKPAFCQFSQ